VTPVQTPSDSTALAGIGKGALSGAGIGTTILPGIGTVVGGFVGALGGGLAAAASPWGSSTPREIRDLYASLYGRTSRQFHELESKVNRLPVAYRSVAFNQIPPAIRAPIFGS
jgi:hypothetical protein